MIIISPLKNEKGTNVRKAIDKHKHTFYTYLHKRNKGDGKIMEKILKMYYADNAWKLHRMVDGILSQFGGLADKDMDDFYSLANEIFVEVMAKYDGAQSFESFLYSCLSNRIKTEMTKRNREKRRADRTAISLDMPVGEDGETTVGDMLVGTFDMERELLEKDGERYSQRMRQYLARLSGLQKEVLCMKTEGYSPDEIRERLHISGKQYADCRAAIRSYRNISVLF